MTGKVTVTVWPGTTSDGSGASSAPGITLPVEVLVHLYESFTGFVPPAGQVRPPSLISVAVTVLVSPAVHTVGIVSETQVALQSVERRAMSRIGVL